MAAKEKRIATVIILNDKMNEETQGDTKKIKRAFEKQNFRFKPDEFKPYYKLKRLMKDRRKEMITGELHLFYIITSVQNYTKLRNDDKKYNFRSILEDLKGTGAKIMIFVQLQCLSQPNVGTRGLSLSCVKRVEYEHALPHSTNMLLAYIPRMRAKGGDDSFLPDGVGEEESTVDILCNELGRSSDINAMMAAVTEWAVNHDLSHVPCYHSTMCEQIALCPQKGTEDKRESSLVIKGGKTFVYLVENFKQLQKNLKERFKGLNEEKNERAVRSLLDRIGLRGEPMRGVFKRGIVKKEDIMNDVKKFVQDQLKNPSVSVRDKMEDSSADVQDRKMDSSNLLTIVISSHGDHGGRIYCSDEVLNLQHILAEVQELKSVPKLIFIDACRGCGLDKAKYDYPFKCTCDLEDLKLKLPANTLLLTSASEGNSSFEGAPFLEMLGSHLVQLMKDGEVDLFHVIHEVTRKMAREDYHVEHEEKANEWELIKLQVTFASTLTKPLRLKLNAHVTQSFIACAV